MIVLVILVEITIPLKTLPLIDTLEVNGHFLSTKLPSMAAFGVLKPKPIDLVYLFSAFVDLLYKDFYEF